MRQTRAATTTPRAPRTVLVAAALGATLLLLTTTVALGSDGEGLAPRPIELEHAIRVDSLVDGDQLVGVVWSVAPAPFEVLARELRRPETWCDVVTLHLNVKACVHDERGGEQRLTLFIGYSAFQSPEQAHPLETRLEVDRQPDRLRATLSADRGPFGTSDHRLELVATPLDADRTALSFRFSQRFSWWARSAMRVFLATWSRHRVGFTQTRPGEWIGGFEGLMERNVVRYHLAIQAYLEHPSDGSAASREARWARWYELTERYPRQLHVLSREDYLDAMRREYAERMRMQSRVGGERLARAP